MLQVIDKFFEIKQTTASAISPVVIKIVSYLYAVSAEVIVLHWLQ